MTESCHVLQQCQPHVQRPKSNKIKETGGVCYQFVMAMIIMHMSGTLLIHIS